MNVVDDAIAWDLLGTKLAASPALSQCTREDIARLLPFLRQQRLRAGEVLCRAGQPAGDMWLVLRGTLRLTRADQSATDVSEGFIGEEAALGIDCYLFDIVAVDETKVLALGRDALPSALSLPDTRARAFCRSVIRAFSSTPFADALEETRDEPLTAGIAVWKLIGWVGAVLSPLWMLHLTRVAGLRWEQQQFAAVLASTVCLWVFGAVRPYVAGLLVVLVCATLGIVPTTVVLSGFASNAFFLALSIFCLGAVLIESGAINRGALLLMKYCPSSAVWYDALALASGLMLTPVVASPVDRARVLGPLAQEASETLGYTRGSRDRTRHTLAVFMGVSLFSPLFLTGSPLNLMLYGSLSEQLQDAVPFLQWTVLAFAALVVMAGAFFAVYALAFPRRAAPRVSRATIDAQLAVLGPVRPREWLAVGGVLLFLGAVATVSAHKIDHRLIALTIICGYLVIGTLGKDELNQRIDWSALILLGTVVGAIAAMMHIGLHEAIAARLGVLSEIMRYQPRTFIVLLAAVVVAGNLVIPMAGALIGLFAVPLAMFEGMSAWVVVFVIVLMSDVWLWPYQSDAYRAFRGIAGAEVAADERVFLRINALMAAARIVALVVSVPYWEQLRVL